MFELVTFVCGCIVINLLCQKRTSPELKKLVLKRHMLYFAFYLLFMISNNINELVMDHHTKVVPHLYTDAVRNIFGLPLALIRISEPYVWAEFKKMNRPIFCCRKAKSKLSQPKFSNESLYSFMTSAMNMEYVCVILIGIGKSEEKPKIVMKNYNLP